MNLSKKRKEKLGEEKLTLNMVAIAVSDDFIESAGVSLSPWSCPKLRRGAKPLFSGSAHHWSWATAEGNVQ